MQAHAGKGVGHLDEAEQQAGQQDAHHNDHKQEAGAAAGVVPGLDAHVLHRQGQAVLIAEDGLVLGAVVLEHPVYVLHPGAEYQVAHEDHHLDYALQQVAQPHGQGDNQADQAGDGGGQEDEQHHGKDDAQGHRGGDKKGRGLLAAQAPVQPKLELGGLLRLLFVLRQEGGREHQRLDAVGQGGTEVEHAPDEGHAQQGVAILDEHPVFHLLLQLAVGLAHHHGLLLRAQHHNPLDEGLAADHSLVGRGAGLVVFVWHVG